MAQTYPPLRERFDASYEVEPISGCYLWTRAISTHGYGRISAWGDTYGAHRIAWFLAHGSLPEDMLVLHRCDTRSCVRADHLFLGTFADNNRDMARKGRHSNQQKTHCPQGHPYDAENTKLRRTRTGVRRRCRKCLRAQDDAYKLRRCST